MYSIGVFTNELSLQRILKLNDLLSQRSYITYLPYTSPDHLRFLYEENQGKFDALLFSGSYPYNVIRKFFPQVADVPHAYFDLLSMSDESSVPMKPSDSAEACARR